MKIVILVIWHIYTFSGNADTSGSIQNIEFNGVIACESALNQIKEKSEYIAGVCVFK